MKQMRDKIFSDSNVLLYLVREYTDKKEKALIILDNKPVISTQVVSENINVCKKKFGLPSEIINKHAALLFNKCDVKFINKYTIELAIDIMVKYKYSYYDSLIVSSALENNCNVLYSEDMQHNQLIENKLRIINPFI